jgi:hypothetical protein
MSIPEITLPRVESRAGAGVAGAGSGTGLVALATALPDDNWLKPWLLFAAPTVTVLATAGWIWVQVEVGNAIQDYRIKTIAKRLRTFLKSAIDDPSCSDNHRQDLQAKLQEVDLVIANRDLSRLRNMAPISKDDVERLSA